METFEELPEQYRDPIKKIVARMREFMAKGEELQAFGFLGKHNAGFFPIPMNMIDGIKKEVSAAILRAMAGEMKPDYAILVSEGYALPPTMPAKEQMALVEKYGSVSDCPQREEIVFISLETPTGCWVACQPILQLEGKSRGFAEFKFEISQQASGRFTNFLPQQPGTVH